jgi:hypothetical protein
MPVLTLVRINGQVPWRTFLSREGNWIAICDPLKLTLQADTWGELMEEIAITLDALLKELLASNELDRFMREHRWTAIGQIPTQTENVRFDLPFIPLMSASHDTPRSLSK